MTEAQIERIVESKVNATDAAYMAGRLTEAEYRAEVKRIDYWARKQIDALPRD